MRGKIAKQIRKTASMFSENYNDYDTKESVKKYLHMDPVTGAVETREVKTVVNTLKKDSARFLTKSVKKWYNSLSSDLKYPGKYMMMFDTLQLLKKYPVAAAKLSKLHQKGK